jgi:hypothetical protein
MNYRYTGCEVSVCLLRGQRSKVIGQGKNQPCSMHWLSLVRTGPSIFRAIAIHSEPLPSIPSHSYPFPAFPIHSQPFEWLRMSFFPLEDNHHPHFFIYNERGVWIPSLMENCLLYKTIDFSVKTKFKWLITTQLSRQ